MDPSFWRTSVMRAPRYGANRENIPMVTIDEAKAMAKRLRSALATELPSLTHSACLELVARQLGHADWNTAVATLVSDAARLKPAIPILRIFDEPKAREFYLEFLGFTVEFEHRFEANLPLYMGVRRSELRLHLSAHHGRSEEHTSELQSRENLVCRLL